MDKKEDTAPDQETITELFKKTLFSPKGIMSMPQICVLSLIRWVLNLLIEILNLGIWFLGVCSCPKYNPTLAIDFCTVTHRGHCGKNHKCCDDCEDQTKCEGRCTYSSLKNK